MIEELKGYLVDKFHSCRWFVKKYYQKARYGFSDEEWWNLDIELARWIVPRLKAFREKTISYPDVYFDQAGIKLEEAEARLAWDRELEEITWTFEFISAEGAPMEDEDRVRVEAGLDLFRKRYFSLWD